MMPEAPGLPEDATVSALHRWGTASLSSVEARRESELLLQHALGRDRAWLFAHATDRVDARACERFAALVAERRRGVPVAYLTGRQGFWTLDLQVGPSTLIPRPETERLVELALERLSPERRSRIADLGTGSGAIALALAVERPASHVLATDASAEALAVALGNAQQHGIENVEFRLGDWYGPLEDERFDLIASNPPYIADGDPHVSQGDLRFEPTSALTSGVDGLDAIRVIAAGAPAHLLPGGWLLLEHGCDQGSQVRAILSDSGLQQVGTACDLELRERVSFGQRPR